MTGRWAYVSDSAGQCADVLQQLWLILNATGAILQAVSLLGPLGLILAAAAVPGPLLSA